MALYECVFIARQDISSSQMEGLVEQFGGIIETGGGQVTKKEMWGLRTLAYRIKKKRKGHYALLHIDAPIDAVHEMERNMRIHEDVLRYLTLRMDELEEGPSIVMQVRERRDDRGGRFGRGGPRGGDRDRGPARPRRDAPAEAAKPAAEAAKPEAEAAKPAAEAAPAAEVAEPAAKETSGEQETGA